MAQHTFSIHHALRTGFLQLFLLIGIAALPSFAFAVDTDGDGVDDSVDAFPNNIEASVDTDGDGKPDLIVNQTVQGFESGMGQFVVNNYAARYSIAHTGAFGIRITESGILSSTLTTQSEISFWIKNLYPLYFYVDNSLVTTVQKKTAWTKITVSVTPGQHFFQWSGSALCALHMCDTYIDDVSYSPVTTLVEDTDDDNDGVADLADAFPLNAAESGDNDNDGTGNNADTDDDNDGFPDGNDNCPLTANSDQVDVDNDGLGDVCDLPRTPVKIEAGFYSSCALTTANGVKCWGYNGGLLGDNSGAYASVIPVAVVGLGSGVVAIAVGDGQACALPAVGGVKCWGKNSYGQLGDNTTVDKPTPVDVVGLGSDVAAITVGGGQTCALTTVGGVKCWGENTYGQLGDNTSNHKSTPVSVMGLEYGVAAIAAGSDHTCALTASGGVKCWGQNTYGQLGDNTTVTKLTPVDVVGLGSGVAAIAVGDQHSCALLTSGGMKCWGYNNYGQLGDNTTVQKRTPVDVVGLGSGVATVTAGARHTCALTADGGVKCWGDNYSGQLGDNTTVNKLTPVSVAELGSCVATVTLGSDYSCALTADGGVKCWGDNYYGQLGYGGGTDKYTPVWVVGFGDPDADGLMDFNDNCPSNANADQLNADGDTQGNVCDSDDDNDGVADGSDAFPLNAAETLDTDLDGTGNNADSDDDNDGLPDAMDPLPLQAKFNLNAPYKGSQVGDQNAVQ